MKKLKKYFIDFIESDPDDFYPKMIIFVLVFVLVLGFLQSLN